MFSPENILNEMNVNSGILDLAAIKMLRNFEGTKKHCIWLIPSSASIKPVTQQLAVYDDELVPVKSFETKNGEGIQFCNEKVGNLLINVYGLKDKAREQSVSLLLALDSHKVTNNIL